MAFKVFIALSLIAVAQATVSGDYGSVGVQTDQTIRVSLPKLIVLKCSF
jgi:hypothetical protein